MKKIVLLVSLLLLLSLNANASLITNGSFELGSYNGADHFQTLGTGSTAMTGWTVTGGSIDWINNYWQASDGNKSLDLVGTSPGTIVGVDFATNIGTTYLVEFDMAGNSGKGWDKSLIGAFIGGTSYNFTFEQAGYSRYNMGWETKSFSFVATSTTTQLQFGDSTQNSRYWGAALDNVRVNPVPEPATMLLFGIGLLGLARVNRRK